MLKKLVRVHLTQWSKIDWERLSIHLAAALFIAVGTAISGNQAHPWPAVIAAVKLWAGASLAYIGGFIQLAEKQKDNNA